MKKTICLLISIFIGFSCFAETYLLNNEETTGRNTKFYYYYNDTDDVFSIKKTNWKSNDNPVFENYLVFTKSQEETLLATLDKYKEWEEKFDISTCEEDFEKEIPDSKLVISKKEYYFFFYFDYQRGMRNYPELVVRTPNANGKLIGASTLYNERIVEIKKYFNRDYFSSNKENLKTKKDSSLQFVQSQCGKAKQLIQNLDKAINVNDFDKAEKLLDEAENCLYEPWKAGPINLEYLYSVSTNPKKELESQKLLSMFSDKKKEIRDKKKKYNTEKNNQQLQ